MAVNQSAQPAINTFLKLGTQGSPQTFTTIANIGDISGPSFSAEVVDVTSHSNGDPWRRKITTLLDGGELTIPLFFIPSSGSPDGHNGTNGLLSVFSNRQLRRYALVFPDAAATTYYFDAYISTFGMKEPVAGVLTADVTFVITGEPILS